LPVPPIAFRAMPAAVRRPINRFRPAACSFVCLRSFCGFGRYASVPCAATSPPATPTPTPPPASGWTADLSKWADYFDAPAEQGLNLGHQVDPPFQGCPQTTHLSCSTRAHCRWSDRARLVGEQPKPDWAVAHTVVLTSNPLSARSLTTNLTGAQSACSIGCAALQFYNAKPSLTSFYDAGKGGLVLRAMRSTATAGFA
jgi:hypothetical protein